MRTRLISGCLAAAIVLTACEREHPTASPEAAALTRQAGQPNLMVERGTSIQEAIDQARPGAVVQIRPGTYFESVTIGKANITLMGLNGPHGEGAVLVNPGGAANGITVLPGADGVAIMNLTTRGYDQNGVFMRGVNGFVVERVTAQDNGAYGIYPVRSSNGVIRHSTASGHADAGLYIGQSENVRMVHNTAFGNVIGIEISNSTDIVARHNHAYDNSIGILAVLLPPSPRRQILVATDVLIAQNRIIENNHPNFAPPTELAAHVPAGSGILVVGTDHATVENNTVLGNDWVGIGVGSTATFGQLAGIPPDLLGLADPHADHVVVRKNTVTGNGNNPPASFPLPGADLLWDGTGVGNCWEKNAFETSFPASLPDC
jgi:parallel beta-helix repeat protein